MKLTDAAYNVVHDYAGGSASLAPRLGKSQTTLNHEVHGTGYAKLGLEDAAKITSMTGDLRILNAFAAQCGCMVIQLPSEEIETNTFQQLAALAKEFSEYVQTVSESIQDGRVTDNELKRTREELGHLVIAAQNIEGHLARVNEEGKPQHQKEAAHK
jgi:hypothetical protein